MSYFKESSFYSYNWARLLSFVLLWSCGLFGYFTVNDNSTLFNVVITFVFASVTSFFVWLWLSGRVKNITLEISANDKKIFAALFLLLFAITFFNLRQPVNGDHFYHIQHAQAYGIIVVEKVFSKLHFLQNVPSYYCIWFVNILFLSILAFGFLLLGKVKPYTGAVLAFVFVVITRHAILFLGGNPDPFPSFRLFPILIGGTLYPFGDMGYKLGAFIFLVAGSFYFYRYFLHLYGKHISFFIALCIATIPVVLHVGTLVEFSLYTAIVWSCIVVYFYNTDYTLRNYQGIIALIVCFSWLRTTVILALVPVVVYMMYDLYQKRFSTRAAIVSLIPCIGFVPILLQNKFYGSPAAYVGTAFSELGIQAHASFFTRIYHAFDSGIVFYAIKNAFPFYLLCTCLALLLLLYRKRFFLFFWTISFFCFSLLFVFSIDPSLWGNGRYQAEYVTPFIVLAIVLLLDLNKKDYHKYCLLIVLIIANLFYFYTIPARNVSWYGHESYFPFSKKKTGYFVLSETPGVYREAMIWAKEQGYAGKVYYPGYLYLYSIMSGYSLKETLEEKDIMESIRPELSTSTYVRISNDKKITLIIINRYPKEINNTHEVFYRELLENKWVVRKTFYNSMYGNYADILERL